MFQTSVKKGVSMSRVASAIVGAILLVSVVVSSVALSAHAEQPPFTQMERREIEALQASLNFRAPPPIVRVYHSYPVFMRAYDDVIGGARLCEGLEGRWRATPRHRRDPFRFAFTRVILDGFSWQECENGVPIRVIAVRANSNPGSLEHELFHWEEITEGIRMDERAECRALRWQRRLLIARGFSEQQVEWIDETLGSFRACRQQIADS
jgi:hypothetical protein